MLLRTDPLCAEPMTQRLTIHPVTVGVLSSNMGPAGPLFSKGNSVLLSCPQVGCRGPWVVFLPCPLTPRDCGGGWEG